MDTVPEVRDESSDSLYSGLYEPEKQNDLFTIFEGPEAANPAAGIPVASTPELFAFGAPSSSTSSTSLPATSPDSAISPSMFAIDPSLTAQSPIQTDTKVEQSHHNLSSADDADIEEDDDDLESVVSSAQAAHKVGGKGQNRKGTVASGGIRKSNGAAPMTQAVRRDDEPLDDDDWRPTPEEYKKMSSKEKRQLRNKISARNFRVRRKEYITTLEGDIAQRDTLIDAIRTELGSTKLENQSLRQEVEALKRALLKGGESPDLPPPAPLSQSPPASAIANKENTRERPATRQALLAKANTQKDLPSSPRLGNSFWGGAKAGGLGGFGGGVTPVHTTLIPDFAPLIPEKLAARAKAPLQENINPALNANPFFGIGVNAHIPTDMQNKASFEAFSDMNPFTLKSIDQYRLQLWNKMGARTAQNVMSPQQANSYAPEGLAAQLRPQYFASPSKSLSVLSGKPSSSSSEKENTSIPKPTPQQAALATLASQTFVQKLGSAFWDAFTSSSSRNWDQDKVRKVLEGKAVVRVVDVAPKKEGVDSLEESMKALAIGNQGGAPSKLAGERLMMRNEPCFLQNMRTGTSALSGKK